MMNNAIVKDGVVINVVVWDGQSEWAPEEGELVLTDAIVGIGWSYDGQVFTAPPIPPVSQEKLIVQAEQQKTLLRAQADSEVAWRQDAVDAGIAMAEETASLAEWKKYRVLLMRVDVSTAPEITWPDRPV